MKRFSCHPRAAVCLLLGRPAIALPAVIGFAIATVVTVRSGGLAVAQSDLLADAEQAAFQEAAAVGAASTVRIEVSGETGAVGDQDAGGSSTGLVVGEDGWIVTTDFAVTPRTVGVIVVLPDGSRHAARVAGRDPTRHLVLLEIDPPQPLVMPVVAPTSQLRVGQWTIAVGRGWDEDAASVAVGVLSAVGRAWGVGVQTDASISPVNYGGPLLDVSGRVIGVLAPLAAESAGMGSGAELYDSGIGFAVPLEDILAVLPRLQEGKTLAAGILGISYASRDVMTGEPVIATCRPGSPAALAGLREGDRITAVDGQSVDRIADVRHRLAVKYAGEAVDLVVRRGKGEEAEAIELEATLVDALPRYRRPMLGILPLPAAAGQPVEVAWVWPDGPAAAGGIVAGDIVERIRIADGDPRDVESAEQLLAIVAGLEVDARVTLSIRRGTETLESQLVTAVATASVPPVAEDAADTLLPVTIEPLTAPEVANPPLAVIPESPDKRPVGVLIHFGPPRGPAAPADAEVWRAAASRHGIAVVIPGSGGADRWSRDDLPVLMRSLEALRRRVPIDVTRVACSGEGAGATFAWLASEAFAGRIRGVALLDGAIPLRSEVPAADPARPLTVLFGQPAEGWTPADASRLQADQQRLDEAAIPHALLAPYGLVPTDDLGRWVRALGTL